MIESRNLDRESGIVEQYLSSARTALDVFPVQALVRAVDLIWQVNAGGKFIYTMGNGGSGSTASHLACDLNKGVSYGKAHRFRVVCLNDNQATVSAYANDVDYADVFVEQLKNFVQRGDLVIGISGSGNSENIVHAIDFARDAGAETLGFVGYDGGRLLDSAEHVVHMPSEDMQIVEDMHMVACHLIMRLLCVLGSDSQRDTDS